MLRTWLIALIALYGTACGCGEAPKGRPQDTALVDLSLRALAPNKVLPGTLMVLEGDSFVDRPWGHAHVRLRGSTEHKRIDVRLEAHYASERRLEVEVDEHAFELLGGRDALFQGEAFVEIRSAVDGKLYVSRSIDVGFEVHGSLIPRVDRIHDSGVIFANEPLAFEGRDLLLPAEGQSVALFEGCFRRGEETACVPIESTEVPIVALEEFDRTRGTFAFLPRIVGIEPGRFEGTVTIRNLHTGGIVHESPAVACRYDLEPPTLHPSPPISASLGEHLVISGAGFVGKGEGDTLLFFVGDFIPDAGELPIAIDVVLLPEFVDGHTVRYVVNEDDTLGTMFDVRYETGVFSGTLTPQIEYGGASVAGNPTTLQLRLAPVKQVVWLNFLPSYRESLRHFGLRAVDQRIRERVVEVVRRDFATVNLEVRTDRPPDFALYSQVDVAGPDPNGLGLLGYDNSPGKDVDNRRLYDRIGGVNALTQEDGFPGYGGVFIESLFGYSEDPKDLTRATRYSPAFDDTFDHFRLERGGTPVLAIDLEAPIPALTGGQSCPTPGGERRLQIACAIWTLGNLIGTTVSHEIGHSLGLADPYGQSFHNSGSAPDRLMDSDRPFEERAEIEGAGPSRFCDDEYVYLRRILPSSEPEDLTWRPPCR